MQPNSQLRRHLPNYYVSRVIAFFHRKRGVFLGPRAIVFAGAKLLRYPQKISIGADAIVKGGAHLCPCNDEAHITIGDRTTIGFHTFIYASREISIGADCMIAPFVYMVDSNHSFDRDTPMNKQPNIPAAIVVEDDVWVGAGAKILAGVTIKTGAIIAAGSVVTKDVGEYEIFAGSPAKKVGDRK